MNRLLRLLLAPPDPLRPLRRGVVAADHANGQRRWAEAEAAYAQALAVDPLRADLWVQYGHTLKEQGRRTEAETAYRSAVAADPASADARLCLAALNGHPVEDVASPSRLLDVDDLPARDAIRVPRPAPAPSQGARHWPSRLAQAPRRSPVVFFHLHKTGGLTLDDVLAAHFAPGRICPVKDDHLHVYTPDQLGAFDLFSGHFDVGALRLLRQSPQTLSILREPRSRLISFYRFHAGHDLGGRHGVNEFAQLANALTAEAFFEHPKVRRAPEVFNHYLSVFSLTYAQVRAAPDVTIDVIDPATVDKAVARVRGLTAVGVVERFDDAVALACGTLGLAPPRAIRSRNQTDQLARKMKGRAPPPVARTERLEAAMADLIRFDQPIYAAAKAEFEKRWSAR